MRAFSFFALPLLSLLLSACAGPITAAPQAGRQEILQETLRQQELVYEKYVSEQGRIFNIAFPLTVANADFCAKRVGPTLGLSAWNIETVEKNYRQAARNLFALDGRTSIRSIAPNSPAVRAGLRPGDVIIAINGQTLPEGAGGIKAAGQLLKQSGYSPAEIIVERAGKTVQAAVKPVAGCDFPVLLDYNDSKINAYADGEKIVISKGIARFTENDSELALVIAHELAHSALMHVNKMQQNSGLGVLGGLAVDSIFAAAGVGTGGQFSQLGGQMALQRYSVPFEQEADYVGMYFMERAGYSTTGVADFWRRMGAEGESSLSVRTTHPTSPERFLAIERTHAEIMTKKRNKQQLAPNIR